MRNNPLAFVDPTGQAPDAAFLGGIYASYQQRKAEQLENCLDAGFLKTGGTALLDTLGLSGLIEGATGQRMLTGTQLSSEQAGERMGTGLASALAILAGPKLTRTMRENAGPNPLGRLLADEGGYLQLGSGPKRLALPAPSGGSSGGGSAEVRADFYVRPSGEAIPATGYRYISQNAKYLTSLEETRLIPANAQGTYITFDRFSVPSPGRLQVPHDAAIRVSFDTLQLMDDLRIPYGKWGTAQWLEPLTMDFPKLGLGGATQAVTNLPIVVDSITRLR